MDTTELKKKNRVQFYARTHRPNRKNHESNNEEGDFEDPHASLSVNCDIG